MFLVVPGREVLLSSLGWRLEMLRITLQCTGRSQERCHPSPNVTSAAAEKPCPRVLSTCLVLQEGLSKDCLLGEGHVPVGWPAVHVPEF